MRFIADHNRMTDTRRFVLELEGADLAHAQFNEHDWLMIDWANREEATVEDRLMGLQTIARRVQEARS